MNRAVWKFILVFKLFCQIAATRIVVSRAILLNVMDACTVLIAHVFILKN